MPKLTKKLPSYRKHRASGQAIVTLGGRDCYLGPYGTAASKREYDRVIGEHFAKGGIESAGDALTIIELLAGFLRFAQQHYGKDGTETQNYRTLIKRLKTAYGHTVANEFGPLRLKAFRDKLIAEKLSRGTVNQTINRTRRIWKWGVENELVRPDVLEALRAVAGLRFGKTEAKETEPIKPVPEAFVDATKAYCSPQVAAMIELQQLTGMRSGEVTIMRTCDINTSGTIWIYTPATHKTAHKGHTRTVYLGPKSQSLVREWLRSDLEAYLFQPKEAAEWHRQERHGKRKTPLSCGNKPGTNRKRKPKRTAGERYDTQGYGRAITRAIDKCNSVRREAGEDEIPHWHPHQLRHNHATHVRREHGLETARILLGHKHTKITEVYAEADQRRAIQVMGEIG